VVTVLVPLLSVCRVRKGPHQLPGWGCDEVGKWWKLLIVKIKYMIKVCLWTYIFAVLTGILISRFIIALKGNVSTAQSPYKGSPNKGTRSIRVCLVALFSIYGYHSAALSAV
jgi:hypothetical protein